MTISVKGTRNETSVSTAAEHYKLQSDERKSRIPHVIAFAVVSIAAYLKSFFSSPAAPAPEPDGPMTGDKQLSPGLEVVQGEDNQAPADPGEELNTASVEEPPKLVVGSGSRLIDPYVSARFEPVQTPELEEYFLAPDAPLVWANTEPISLVAQNDNTPLNSPSRPNVPVGSPPDQKQPIIPDPPGGQTPPGTPGSGGSDPTDPGGNGSDPGDNGSPGGDGGTPTAKNRAPRVSAPVKLYDLSSCALLVIGLMQLLEHAEDPDGDPLSIVNLSTSSGTITQTGAEWIYTPDQGYVGEVTLSYQITDGELSVAQTAHFSVLERGLIIGGDGDDDLVGSECADDIHGGAGDDHIDARGGDDVIFGGDGNDHILAGSGNDLVYAGAGNDIVHAGAGNDVVYGGAGHDTLFGEDGDDVLYGEEGNDEIDGGAGTDVIYGGSGNDVISGGSGNDRAFGGEGEDVIFGGQGDDDLSGGAGADVVYGGTGEDNISGGQGDDVLFGEEGDDDLSGGAGRDIIYGGAGKDQLDGGEGNDVLFGDEDDDEISGGAGEDVIHGGGGDDIVDAGDGDDVVHGNAGDDRLKGGDGDDVIHGGDGDDCIEDGSGSDVVLAGDGNDHVFAAMDAISDVYLGGAGCDTIDYSAAQQDLRVDLVNRIASGVEIGEDSITGFEKVVAGSGNDHLIAGSQAASFTGGDGSDIFEFTEACTPVAEMAHPSRFEILDFDTGDRVRLSKYDLFEKVFGELENDFERIYGDEVDEDDVRIRYRHEKDDTVERTIIEADFDRDRVYETVITVEGTHLLVIVEHA
ncbi:cadherin-like domain-containing protein [Nitratireductor basaltis]|uniref:Hemolysin-type calcium-binding region n=1 Tax=Nitratireductor basaltis TaxID=472175 RepID=A0A084U640_9HYPH|nr:cadherin-like domain-containing protein [Nitratireductor basaltis]KFB08426.1 Hemolysin-type calcium-binding region [Nitratireductor basaltis]